MDTTNNSSKTDWAIFFVSAIAMIALIMFLPEWSWLVLPFVITYLARAMNVI